MIFCPAEMITSEERTEHTAYLMRSETVMYAPNDGGVSYQYMNGEKVNKGSVVAKVYSGSDGAAIKSELVSYDNRLSILARSEVDEDSRFVGTQIIDQEISALYATIMEKLAQQDLDFVQQKQDELNILLNRKNVIIGNVNDFDEAVLSYESKRDELVDGLGSAYSEVTADTSGYFYANVDGYEDIFDAGKIDDLTIDEFDAMAASKPETVAEKGYAVGKMVTEFKWYIVFEINIEDMKKYTVNKNYTAVFPYNADTRISMR